MNPPLPDGHSLAFQDLQQSVAETDFGEVITYVCEMTMLKYVHNTHRSSKDGPSSSLFLFND